jgi:hypothetical protein
MFYTYELEDVNGDMAQMRVKNFVDDTATVASLVANSDAFGTFLSPPGTVTNAKVVRTGVTILRELAQTTPGAPNPPLDAWFPSVADKAVLTFANSNGYRARLAIPAPVEAVFHAPPADLNVDPANAAIAALITGFEALAHDATHTALNLYTGGTYQGSRSRRRRGRM